MTIPTTSWDETSPAGSQALSLGDNRIRELKTQIREIVDVDHKFDSSGQDADMGKHNKVSFLEAADIGTGAVGKPILGAQTVSGKAELVFTDEDDNDVQLTTGGKIKIAGGALTDGQILVGNSSGVATDVAVSGDVTISNTGAVTIANDAVETAMIADDAVTGAKLAGVVGVPGTYHVSATGTTTTTSSTYGDLSDITLTFTPSHASNPILIMFSCDLVHSGAGENISVILDIGGNVAETARTVTSPNVNKENAVSFQYYTTLAASSQTVKVQWKTTSATATCRARALTVIEFKQN